MTLTNCRYLPLPATDTCQWCQSTMTVWQCLVATRDTCLLDTRSWDAWTESSGMEQFLSAKKLSATSQPLGPHQRCSNCLILFISLQYYSQQPSHIEGINLMMWLEKSSQKLSQSRANQLEPMHSCVILDSH